MERTMKMMSALMVVGALAACDSGNVTGPTIVAPGPGGDPGPGPDAVNGVDIQGSGILATESRDVAGFSRVRLDGVGHLIVEQGGAEALMVTADDNILALVTAEVHGDELRLGTEPGATWASPNMIVFTLTVADIDFPGWEQESKPQPRDRSVRPVGLVATDDANVRQAVEVPTLRHRVFHRLVGIRAVR